ncbi:DUF1684 domain-containing protein [Nocardioides sp. YIM 152588]|uniref:DUF1684 domain-containing protein n=1 Tax=Nocardioides sp. YIM 152588 TaxID=3158259 RepID=UPI0032E508B4
MSDFLDRWQAFRDAREARLRDQHGYLSITALHWLTDEPQRLDGVPGAWWQEGDAVRVRLSPGESLGLDGADLGSGVHTLGAVPEEGRTVTFGDAVAEVADRDGRAILRPRHPDSPLLASYRGTPCYAPDEAWALPGRFEPCAGDGTGATGEVRGEVVVEHAGAEHRLLAWSSGDERLWILFRDATSGVTTYPASRQVLVDPPAADGSVLLDLNRAINMPCAYTDHVTCPLPPAANTLPFAVEAGERMPEQVLAGA